MMTEEKKSVENVDFRGTKQEPDSPKANGKKKMLIVITSALVVLGSAVLVVCLALLLKTPEVPKTLVNINLNEGDTLSYRVDQRFEVSDQNLQRETITSIVGLRVVHKTPDVYLFFLKINTTFIDEQDKVKGTVSGYFRVRVHIPKGSKENQTEIEALEVYGPPETDKEFVRYLHGVLYQLLPTVRRDLYEDVDGQKDNNTKPENSHLFPGPIRMHRQAKTKKGGNVLIQSHFNRSDLVNSSSDIDLDVKYADSAAINKSNGMVSESNVFLYERLNFGEPIKTKDGFNVTMMNVKLYSHVIRIEVDNTFFEEEKIKNIEFHLFVKLVVPPTNMEMPGQHFSTQTPTTANKRNRRAMDAGKEVLSNKKATLMRKRRGVGGNDPKLKEELASLLKSNLAISLGKNFAMFEKKVIGINMKGETNVRLTLAHGASVIGAGLNLKVGPITISVFDKEYDLSKTETQAEKKNKKDINLSWSREVPLCFRMFILNFCVNFRFTAGIGISTPEFKADESSLSPLKFAIELGPFAEVKVTAEASVGVVLLRGGLYADGTVFRADLPVKLSYNSVMPAHNDWCITTDVRLTAFELEAGLFYQWKHCVIKWLGWIPYPSCQWGVRKTFMSFGKWAAIRNQWKAFHDCF